MKNHAAIRYFFDHRLLLLLLLFTSAVYFKGITPSFSSDDFVHLENNIHFETLVDAAEVFIKPYGREYRPLVRLSLWANHQMGDSAIAYKISNLAMHLMCILLLYGLMQRLGVNKTAALIASGIFALHPIHTTSVHFILGRTDLVAAVFYLATLYCVAGWKKPPGFAQQAITFVWFSAALLSKELSITLTAMMLAILLVQQQTLSPIRVLRTALTLWPYALLALIYLLARIYQWKSMDAAVSGLYRFLAAEYSHQLSRMGLCTALPLRSLCRTGMATFISRHIYRTRVNDEPVDNCSYCVYLAHDGCLPITLTTALVRVRLDFGDLDANGRWQCPPLVFVSAQRWTELDNCCRLASD